MHPHTALTCECPADAGDPYHPILRDENAARYARYEALGDATPGVSSMGRPSTYRHYNMDQVVALTLALYARLFGQPRVVAAAA